MYNRGDPEASGEGGGSAHRPTPVSAYPFLGEAGCADGNLPASTYWPSPEAEIIDVEPIPAEFAHV